MVRITGEYQGDLHCSAVHGPSGDAIETDAPKDNQGRGEAFSPTDLVATGFATCIATTMAIVARRHGVDIAGIRYEVTKEMSADAPRRISRLARPPVAAARGPRGSSGGTGKGGQCLPRPPEPFAYGGEGHRAHLGIALARGFCAGPLQLVGGVVRQSDPPRDEDLDPEFSRPGDPSARRDPRSFLSSPESLIARPLKSADSPRDDSAKVVVRDHDPDTALLAVEEGEDLRLYVEE